MRRNTSLAFQVATCGRMTHWDSDRWRPLRLAFSQSFPSAFPPRPLLYPSTSISHFRPDLGAMTSFISPPSSVLLPRPASPVSDSRSYRYGAWVRPRRGGSRLKRHGCNIINIGSTIQLVPHNCLPLTLDLALEMAGIVLSVRIPHLVSLQVFGSAWLKILKS